MKLRHVKMAQLINTESITIKVNHNMKCIYIKTEVALNTRNTTPYVDNQILVLNQIRIKRKLIHFGNNFKRIQFNKFLCIILACSMSFYSIVMLVIQKSKAKQFVKIICQNHATCFCGLFIFALFFYFQIHDVCVKDCKSFSSQS